MKHRLLLLIVSLVGMPLLLLGQENFISGVVASEGEPLIGATVVAEGTAKGTVTDFDGKFELSLPEGANTLVITYTGYQPQRVEVGNRTNFEIEMDADEITLGEVVVTALGVERDKKALGYAVQDVEAAELQDARSTNVVNNLSGRVAGLQITQGNVPGGGSQVTIRGNASILGNNQPLYVIDGVPMEGDFAAPIEGAADNNIYGGGISEISPDNIASVTVLKGANAAALYGSRAANGVILVTTKNGSQAKGLGVEYFGGMTFDNPLVVPEFQNTYGGGNGYVTWYHDGRNGGITDPLEIEQFRNAYPDERYPLVGTAGVDESWGAPMDGRLVRHWWTGDEVAPLTPQPDTWSNFWETGKTMNHNVAIAGGNDRGSFRFAFGRTDQQGIYYNNDFSRNNFRLNTQYKLTDRFHIRASGEYIKSGSDNRQQPVLWELQTWHNRHNDWGLLKEWERFMDVHNTREGDDYPYANWQHSFAGNRFYDQEFLTNGNDKDRFLGNIALTYDFTDWLSLMVRTGTDIWTDTRIGILRNERTKSFDTRTQSFEEDVIRRQETNSDFILTFDKYVLPSLSINAQFGGVHRTNYFKRNYIRVNDVTINGLYNVANNASTNTNLSRIEEKEVNSLFGAVSIGFNNYLYLDITGRNDWSSTLPVDNNSYFYPSFSLSMIVSDMLNLNSNFLSFAKLRGSWAQVGNDTDPYRLAQVFTPEAQWNATTPVFAENTVIANSDLRPERTTGIEFGADLRFFQGRLGLDFTYYDQTTTDQIIDISVSKATGYDSKVINAGSITNKGFEIILNGAVIDRPNFRWDVTLNYARNQNRVNELFTDANGNVLETIVLRSRRGLSLEARVDQPYGTLFGSAYERVPDGPMAGQIVFQDGIPQVQQDLQVIGNVMPDWLGGIQNSFSWKGLTVSALIDAKIGGDIADESSSTGMQTGIYPITALGREEGVIGLGAKNVGSAENPEWVANDVVMPTKSVTRMLSVRSVNEGAIYEASYIKLREVSIAYSLPRTVIDRIGFIQGIRLALVGRNVAMLYNTHSQIDPEMNNLGGNLQGGLYYATLPSTRSLGFNVGIKF